MKNTIKFSLLSVALLVFGVMEAWADTTTATSTTALNVTVYQPVSLTCDSASVDITVVKPASGDTTSAEKSFTCTASGGASTITHENLVWRVTDLQDSASTPNTLAATNVGVGATSGNEVYASAANTEVATALVDTDTDTLDSSWTFYVNVKVPADTVASTGAYSGTITETLTVTYTP